MLLELKFKVINMHKITSRSAAIGRFGWTTQRNEGTTFLFFIHNRAAEAVIWSLLFANMTITTGTIASTLCVFVERQRLEGNEDMVLIGEEKYKNGSFGQFHNEIRVEGNT